MAAVPSFRLVFEQSKLTGRGALSTCVRRGSFTPRNCVRVRAMKLRFTLLLFALLVPVAALAAAGDVMPFQASEKTLPNGLKVIVVPTGFPNIVAMYIPVQTGSRNEIEPGKSGFAHFFEHMMSRGTPTYPPEKYNEVVTKAGARENANTSDDRTVYHIVFAREDLPKI